jgi:hypothetical protein
MRKIVIAALLLASAVPVVASPPKSALGPLNPAFRQTLKEARDDPALAPDKIDPIVLRYLGVALTHVCPLDADELQKWEADMGLTPDEQDIMGQLCLAYMEGQGPDQATR